MNRFIISFSTRGVIGQFCRPYFTVRPAKFENCSFPARLINLRDMINILLTSFLFLFILLHTTDNNMWTVKFRSLTMIAFSNSTINRGISAVKQCKPLRSSQSKNLNKIPVSQSISWRLTAGQRAWGLWVRDYRLMVLSKKAIIARFLNVTVHMLLPVYMQQNGQKQKQKNDKTQISIICLSVLTISCCVKATN